MASNGGVIHLLDSDDDRESDELLSYQAPISFRNDPTISTTSATTTTTTSTSTGYSFTGPSHNPGHNISSVRTPAVQRPRTTYGNIVSTGRVPSSVCPPGSVMTVASVINNRSNITPVVNNNNQRPVKKAKKDRCHALIWVCTHGKGRRSDWRQKDLKIVGIYPNKAAAQEAKEEVMAQYDNAGYGDILVGDFCDDEIDLVIREAPMFL